jgi:hypothetical protein
MLSFYRPKAAGFPSETALFYDARPTWCEQRPFSKMDKFSKC